MIFLKKRSRELSAIGLVSNRMQPPVERPDLNSRTDDLRLRRMDVARGHEAYVAADPFTAEGVALYEVTEVAVTRTAAGLDALKE